ncbi:MAG: hypothetical protein AB7O67_15365 [Vicinamibacterales bacterium]
MRYCLSVAVLLCLCGATACTDPNAARRQALTSDVQRLSADYSVLSHSIAVRTARVADAQRRVEGMQAELADYRRRVNAFMMNHKMAVAALALGGGGAAVALDSSNSFSRDARAIGGVAAFLALAYAIDNADEVANVADQLFQADRYVKALSQQIAELSSAHASESQLLAQEQSALQELQGTLDDTRAELERLQ